LTRSTFQGPSRFVVATVWQHGEAENCSGVKIADFGRSDAIVLLLADDQDQLADVDARLEHPVSSGCIAQRKRFVDDRRDDS
jgi:hypothetical protein